MSESLRSLVYQVPLLKGICIIAVVSIHVTGRFQDMAKLDWLAGVLICLNSLGRFAAPIFVVLSAFHLSLNRRNEQALNFYRRTLRFLVVPYVLYSFAYMLVFYAPHLPVAALPRTFARHLVHGSAAYHLWFMVLILELYVVHPFLSRWYRARDCRIPIVLLAFGVQIISSVSQELGLLPRSRWLGVAYVGLRLVSNLGYIFAGYYLQKRADVVMGVLRRSGAAAVGGVLWLLSALAVAVSWAHTLAGDIPFRQAPHHNLVLCVVEPILSVAALSLMIKWVASGRPVSSIFRGVLSSFGLYSYGVYYLHPLLLHVVSFLLWQCARLDPRTAVFQAALFVIGAAFSVAAAKGCARLPIGRYLT